MFSILLCIIYAAFISLGLPDSLIGSAWPVMSGDLNLPLSFAGAITMIISFGTIVSSVFSSKLTRKFGTGVVTAVSVLLTAAALLSYSFATAPWMICLIAVPYGLGAGAVDAALNNYVALHYASRHMSWLHCFWGVGATVGPYIMGACLSGDWGWRGGFTIIAIIQGVLTVMLFCALPLWNRNKSKTNQDAEVIEQSAITVRQTFKLKGVVFVLAAFLAYCALEQTTGLWAATFLVNYRGIDSARAASFSSLFFLGITVGRLISGFVTEKLGDKKLIRIGIGILSVGIVLVALPVKVDWLALTGLAVIGLGCAPIYPSIIHATPANFGKANSQAVIGLQMAFAYVGATFMPPVFGLLAQHVNIVLFTPFLALFAVILIVTSELLFNSAKKYPPKDGDESGTPTSGVINEADNENLNAPLTEEPAQNLSAPLPEDLPKGASEEPESAVQNRSANPPPAD